MPLRETYDTKGKLLSSETTPVGPEETTANTIRDNARLALVANRAYTSKATPTAAETTAQVKALSRQNNGLIRLLIGLLDGTD